MDSIEDEGGRMRRLEEIKKYLSNEMYWAEAGTAIEDIHYLIARVERLEFALTKIMVCRETEEAVKSEARKALAEDSLGEHRAIDSKSMHEDEKV